VHDEEDGGWQAMYNTVAVDDLKISHVDSKVLDTVLGDVNEKYGKEAPIAVT
jgi:hypothetical protein